MLVRCYWMGSGDKLLYNLFYSAWVELVHHTTNGIFDTPFWGFLPNTHDAPASSYKFMIAHINMDFFSLGHLNIHKLTTSLSGFPNCDLFRREKHTQLLSHSATPRSFRQQTGHQLAVLRRCLRHIIDGSLQVRMNCFDLPKWLWVEDCGVFGSHKNHVLNCLSEETRAVGGRCFRLSLAQIEWTTPGESKGDPGMPQPPKKQGLIY